MIDQYNNRLLRVQDRCKNHSMPYMIDHSTPFISCSACRTISTVIIYVQNYQTRMYIKRVKVLYMKVKRKGRPITMKSDWKIRNSYTKLHINFLEPIVHAIFGLFNKQSKCSQEVAMACIPYPL